MQPKPYLTVQVSTEKHNSNHNQWGSHEAMSNSHLPELSNVSKKISLILHT